MLYDRVMRSIQNRHKRIKHMNLFINARFQRKLRKFAENPLPGSQVSRLGSRLPLMSWIPGLRFQVPGLRSQVPGPIYQIAPESRVLGPTNSARSRVQPCMWRNKTKTETKPSHVTFKLSTRSIFRSSSQTIRWYSMSDVRVKKKITWQ